MDRSLLAVPRYRRFVQERDRALDQLNNNFQLDLSRLLFSALDQVEHLAVSLAHRAHQDFRKAPEISQHFDRGVDEIFNAVTPILVNRISRMRKAAYTLTYLSELEAIAQATQTRQRVTKTQFKQRIADAVMKKTSQDATLTHRVWYNLMKLRAKLTQAFMLGVIQELTPLEIQDQVKAKMPYVKAYKKPPRALKPIREASLAPLDHKQAYDNDFVDDSDWDMAVDAYKSTELPPTRFDNVSKYDPDTSTFRYDWELEQETTQDFVDQVRAGQVEAANDLGVEEFVWVAIIDDHTDDCCMSRAGKTTSEIEADMDSGKIDSDVCDSTVPPAHFNCRCTCAPVASPNPVEGPDWASFNDWLNS